MVKVRAVLTGLVLATMVALAAPAAPALAAPVSVHVTAADVVTQQTTDPGPRIDPEQTSKANQEKTKNKIVVGVLAALLALIVLWGRSVRKKRRKASS
ncbi:hypothetical protein [Amycolatopsis thermophila]|uniref:Uncharacterized protein n=1 Tax=Amycolatopsis thermophila TaxID=206084 RepID=A0ABU0EQD0_9PSEU|nr:hypothetical protein [Amycolatopsis thermophila]MDQ0377364.1 hypothetical protein [Amycolatopsis thermophila]